MRTRALTRAASSVDVENRTFEAILVTETPVRTWIPDPSGKRNKDGFVELIEVDEVLLVSGLDRSRTERMPLLACHNAFDLKDYLGQINEVRAEEVEGQGPCVVITAQFKPSLADMANDVAHGFYPNMSAGYVVNAYELEMRSGNVPVAYATDWTLQEGSLVPLGADPNARVRSATPSQFPLPTVRVRSAQPTPETRSDMDFAEAIAAAEAAIAAAEEAVAAIPNDAPEGTEEALVERAKSVRSRLARAETPKEERPADPAAEEAKRAAEAAAQEEAEKAERAEVEQVRSLARTFGEDVLATADAYIALGARGAALKADVLDIVRKRNATVQTKTTAAPQTGQLGQRSNDTGFSYRDALKNMNGAFKGR